MNCREFGRERSIVFIASACIESVKCAARWLNVLLTLIVGVSWCCVASADILDVNLSSATVSGQVPISSQFLPDVVGINFYVDNQYATSTSGSTGSYSWNSTATPDGNHDITAVGYDASGMVSGYSNIHLLIANSSPSTPSGTVPISGYADQYIEWINLYVDSSYAQSTGGGSWSLSQSFAGGRHQVQISGYEGNDVLMASAQVGGVNFGGGNSSASGSTQAWSVTPGATISGLSGSAANLSGADTNPSDYGSYPASWNGFGAMGGPLLNDIQAAQKVIATPTSNAENNAYGTASQNASANNYFNNIAQNNPSDYLNQLSSFHSAYQGGAWTAAARVDGACPMANPTTAEILQWAANKWGIHPLILYAVATNEAHWDETAVNEHGGNGNEDAGLFQVADRGATHAFPGFTGAGSNLASENSCFNADFFAAWLWGTYNGQTSAGSGNVGTAIESWASPYATSPDGYADTIWGILTNQDWIPWYFSGQNVPY